MCVLRCRVQFVWLQVGTTCGHRYMAAALSAHRARHHDSCAIHMLTPWFDPGLTGCPARPALTNCLQAHLLLQLVQTACQPPAHPSQPLPRTSLCLLLLLLFFLLLLLLLGLRWL